jgi:hypothetical protein
MPSDKLPRRMLTAWVYQVKGSSAMKFDAKKTTYGGTVARYHCKYAKKVEGRSPLPPALRGDRARHTRLMHPAASRTKIT